MISASSQIPSRSHSNPSTRPSQTPLPSTSLDSAACWTETFRQPTQTRKLDLLFVTDTSGSLDDERDEIADGIDSFVRALPAGHDTRIGVMLGHSPASPYSGRLWRSDGGYFRANEHSEPWALSSLELSRGLLRAKLKNKLRKQASEGFSDGGEMGIASLLRGIEARNLNDSQAKGFFRSDAALAVIFVSDENDICANYPAGIEPVRDPDGKEAPARRKFCTANSGNNPENLFQKLSSLQGNRPLIISGILYGDSRKVPRGGENEVGYGYIDAIRVAGTNGFLIEMSEGHFEEGLRRLGEFTSEKIELRRLFPISHPATELSVQVDGRAAAFRVIDDQIELSDLGSENSVVSIRGCVTPSVTPEPSTTPEPTGTSTPEVTPTATPTVAPEPTATPTPSTSPDPVVTTNPIDPGTTPVVIGI